MDFMAVILGLSGWEGIHRGRGRTGYLLAVKLRRKCPTLALTGLGMQEELLLVLVTPTS